MKILIVEDVKASQKIIERFVQDYGTCTFASDGEEGLKAFVAAQTNNEPFELVFLDIMLPQIDGIELLQLIRKAETTPKQTKIVMITSLTDQKHVLAAIKNGCDGYIYKPFVKEDIVKQLTKLKLI